LSALLLGILIFQIFNHLIAFITSFLGSYLFVRGLSIFIGGFPP